MGIAFGKAPGQQLRFPFEPGPHFHPGSDLHDKEKGRVLVVVGNAWSLNDIDLDLLTQFKTIGCNRCLRPDFVIKKPPDYYVCVDRDPYAQMRDYLDKYKGVPVLSKMLFDPNNMHKKTPYRTQWAPIQPLPKWDWWGFRPVSSSRARERGSRSVYTRWPERHLTLSNGMIPAFGTDLDMLMAHGANVGYAMFQIAAAMGAGVIGIAGIDLEWKGKKTHAFGDGDGRKAGAFRLNAGFTLPFFKIGYAECQRQGIEVYNLSPRGCLTPPMPRVTVEEFHRRFGRYADGTVLYPGKQQQSDGGPPGLPSTKSHSAYRYKSHTSYNRNAVAHGGRPRRSGRGVTQREARKRLAASLREARRKGGSRKDDKGGNG